MCCCGKPVINGEPGYSWDGKEFSTRPVSPPQLEENDVLLFDEPGRCGGINSSVRGTDSHCHHYRVVMQHCTHYLLVQNGGGLQRISLSGSESLVQLLRSLDSNARYWLLNSMAHTMTKLCREEKQKLTNKWATAFLRKTIKKRKRKGVYSVWIEEVTPVVTK